MSDSSELRGFGYAQELLRDMGGFAKAPDRPDGGALMGNKQNQTKDRTQGQGSQNKGQGQYRGQGQPMSGPATTTDQGGWNDRAQRPMQQGDETRPAQPSGTSPLDKDQQPVNQNRPDQQNR